MARNLPTPILSASRGKVLKGKEATEREGLYRLRTTQRATGKAPQLRRTINEYVVPYERLSLTLRQLNQKGCQILSITNA